MCSSDLDKKLELNQEEYVEDVPLEALYSVIYFAEALDAITKGYIENYIKTGVKVYLLLNQTAEEYKEALKEEYIDYEQFCKAQLLQINFECNLEIEAEQPYIVDGIISEEAFYTEVRKTQFNYEQYEIEHASIEANLLVKAGAGTDRKSVV